MEIKILRLIYDYSVKGKLVDSEFIDKIIEIVVSEKCLNEYVRKVRFTKQLGEFTPAAYNPFTMEILLACETIGIIIKKRSCYEALFDDLEKYMFRNLIIVHNLLHELEHAYQLKQAVDDMDDSIEGRLIKSEFNLERAMKNPKFWTAVLMADLTEEVYSCLVRKGELYEKYYEMNPTERFAEINSYRTILNSVKPIEKYIPNLYEFETALLGEQMLRGYLTPLQHELCPTRDYLFATNQTEVWFGFDFYDQDSTQLMKNVSQEFSLERRLQLGLPISYDERDETNAWLQSTNKFKS